MGIQQAHRHRAPKGPINILSSLLIIDHPATAATGVLHVPMAEYES
jgi:hypothetical protein